MAQLILIRSATAWPTTAARPPSNLSTKRAASWGRRSCLRSRSSRTSTPRPTSSLTPTSRSVLRPDPINIVSSVKLRYADFEHSDWLKILAKPIRILKISVSYTPILFIRSAPAIVAKHLQFLWIAKHRRLTTNWQSLYLISLLFNWFQMLWRRQKFRKLWRGSFVSNKRVRRRNCNYFQK